MSEPLRFIFGVHVHQPVGNFDHVFDDHVRDVYQPFLERLADAGCLPIALHLSGPLLEWLETRHSRYLDLVGRLASDGKIEMLLSGFYEPVLASLPRADRIEQITWMREALRRRFGVEATGLWLTERVWEPDLAGDLAEAGVRYALVDDRHFLVTGFRRDQLHAPFWTEANGRRLALFPIDEKMRYLLPFKPPEELASYLGQLRSDGHRMAVFADDGEKFGGWPGTKQWVYERGWLSQFLDTMRGLAERGEARLCTPSEALREVPSGGLAYLPSASYREMEHWSLPPEAASRLVRLEKELGEARIAGPEGALVRGAHWRNFLTKYPEANRMHKQMLALSALCRARGDPPEARRAIGRAQCNDAYWHGVFGGLYLPHLREAVWRNLSHAEGVLRTGEPLAHEIMDFDGDGFDEVCVHSSAFSAVVSPRRGGALELFVRFGTGVNYADVLTRRREAYHELALAAVHVPAEGDEGTPSIQEIEHALSLRQLPPFDPEERAMFVDRVLPGGLSKDDYARGAYQAVRSWAREAFAAEVTGSAEGVEVHLTADALAKRLRFEAGGALSVHYTWDPAAFPADAFFAPEISLFRPLELRCTPETELWSFPVATVAKSERGLDQTVQGESLTPRWPVAAGGGSIVVV
ncbi:MAG: alpha-amylase/4-alpha-glucanotransferase domain-containing protein [Gemmatimonadota bacterium]